MHTLAIHPQSQLSVNSTDVSPRNYDSRHNSCSPTKRLLRFITFIVLVGIGVICAIVIPLVLYSAKKKDTTIPTTESTKLMNTTYFTIQSTTKLSTNRVQLTTANELSIAPIINHTDHLRSTVTMHISFTSNDSLINTMTTTKTTEKTSMITSTESKFSEQTTTTSRPLISLNHINDTIISVYNTTAGKPNGGINGTYNDSSYGPHNAMDDNLTTIHFNMAVFGKIRGVGTGFIVVPSISNSTVACGIRFAIAGPHHHRNPLTVTLEGSNVSTIQELIMLSNWTLLYNGSTGIPPNSTQQKYYETQLFANTESFQSYRLLITSTGGTSYAVEYSEARIMGYF